MVRLAMVVYDGLYRPLTLRALFSETLEGQRRILAWGMPVESCDRPRYLHELLLSRIGMAPMLI